VTTKALSLAIYLRLHQAQTTLPFLYRELLEALRLRVQGLDVERLDHPFFWRYSWSWLQPRNFAFIDRTKRKLKAFMPFFDLLACVLWHTAKAVGPPIPTSRQQRGNVVM